MPFCPSCGSEFRAGTTRCSDCDVELGAKPAVKKSDGGEWVDVFACYDDQAVTRATEILDESEIESVVRDRSSSAFPTNVGTSALKVLAVAPGAVKAACEVLQQALDDKVLVREGGSLIAD